MSEKNTKLAAYAAIAAIWLVWLADLAIDIRTMFDDGFWQNMAHLAPWRVEAATFALFLFPLVSGGVYVLNKGLRRPWLCLLLVFCSAPCAFICTAAIFILPVPPRIMPRYRVRNGKPWAFCWCNTSRLKTFSAHGF